MRGVLVLCGFANRSIGEKDEVDGSSLGGTKCYNNELPLPGNTGDRTIRILDTDAGSIWGEAQELSFEEVDV